MNNNKLRITQPCTVPWDSMDGLENGNRFCSSCSKVVHDLTASTPAEIEALYKSLGGQLCGRAIQEIKIPIQTLVKRTVIAKKVIGRNQISIAASAATLLLLSQAHAQVAAPLALQQIEWVDSTADGDSLLEQTIAEIAVTAVEDSSGLDTTANSANSAYFYEWRQSSCPDSGGPNIEGFTIELSIAGMMGMQVHDIEETNEAGEEKIILRVKAIPFDENAPRSTKRVQKTPAKSDPKMVTYFFVPLPVETKRKRYRQNKKTRIIRRKVPLVKTVMPWDK